ncbi:MAG: hypothetical protein SD837_22025 [Candidatus Electrothrix scaldis]|nr:MAG: hypothetical protein SD837_22025 [Candidatus Electrothrix sp. GW3-3]
MDFLSKIDSIFYSRYTAILLLLCSILLSLISYQQHSELIALAEFLNFAVEHKCEIVSHKEGENVSSFGHLVTPKGNLATGFFITTQPDVTGYRCDDGVIYYR